MSFYARIASLEAQVARIAHHLSKTASGDHYDEVVNLFGGLANMTSVTNGSSILPTSFKKGIIFSIPYVRGVGIENIKLTQNDEGNYDVIFFGRMSGTTPKIKKQVKNVSPDMLRTVVNHEAKLNF